VPIRIAARIDKENCEYFDEMIRPLLDDSSAEYIGEVTAAEKSEFLSGAVALLDPAASPEPSGLVMIEALACGTPVIAFNRGSAPEIVDEGWTGFIVEDENGAVDAFDLLERLSRQEIRSRFEQRFTARYMALEYLDVYRSVMDCDGITPPYDGYDEIAPPYDANDGITPSPARPAVTRRSRAATCALPPRQRLPVALQAARRRRRARDSRLGRRDS
jgi:hypothetical protein